MSDHYLSVSTGEDFIERHVDLSPGAAERLSRKLEEMKVAGQILEYMVDGSEPEYWTSGYEDTLDAILDGLGLREEDE